MALAFDKGEAFAIDKPAGRPCPNLDGPLCRIHENLEERGFPGCARYDCRGAGQRATALFGGNSWQTDPRLLPPMMDAFRQLRQLHDLIDLLHTARTLRLPPAPETERLGFLYELCGQEMTIERAESLATGPLPQQVRAFLKGLTCYSERLRQ